MNNNELKVEVIRTYVQKKIIARLQKLVGVYKE